MAKLIRSILYVLQSWKNSINCYNANILAPKIVVVKIANCLITASYSGDSNYSVSVSNVVVQVVKDKNKATINLSSSLNPSDVGQSVKFTAAMSPINATGTVQFQIDGKNFGSAVGLSGGSASFSKSDLTAVTHNITAAYSGDDNFDGSNSSGISQVIK